MLNSWTYCILCCLCHLTSIESAWGDTMVSKSMATTYNPRACCLMAWFFHTHILLFSWLHHLFNFFINFLAIANLPLPHHSIFYPWSSCLTLDYTCVYLIVWQCHAGPLLRNFGLGIEQALCWLFSTCFELASIGTPMLCHLLELLRINSKHMISLVMFLTWIWHYHLCAHKNITTCANSWTYVWSCANNNHNVLMHMCVHRPTIYLLYSSFW